jgi:hypothetical protein
MTENTKICDEFSGLPSDPIDSIVDPLKRFLHIEFTSGCVLLVAIETVSITGQQFTSIAVGLISIQERNHNILGVPTVNPEAA